MTNTTHSADKPTTDLRPPTSGGVAQASRRSVRASRPNSAFLPAPSLAVERWKLDVECSPSVPAGLHLADAVRIQSAVYRLRLGHADAASRELEALSRKASRHPWALRIQWAVVSALTYA